jgi:hypothetical protein
VTIAQPRTFPGRRWLMTGLRSAHLVGVGGIGGAYLYEGPREIWLPFLVLTLVSGILMTALELWSSRYWLVEIRGLAIAIKVLLLGLVGMLDQFEAAAFIFVIVLSGVTAHAPAAVRYYSVWHRQRTH